MDVGLLMFVHASLVAISFLCRSANMAGVLSCLMFLFSFECVIYFTSYFLVKIIGVAEDHALAVSDTLADIDFSIGISVVSLIAVVIAAFV